VYHSVQRFLEHLMVQLVLAIQELLGFPEIQDYHLAPETLMVLDFQLVQVSQQFPEYQLHLSIPDFRSIQ